MNTSRKLFRRLPRRSSLLWAAFGVCLWLTGFSLSALAQFTANYQTNTISGVTSNWTGDYYVGSNTFSDALLIQSSGVLSNGAGYVGYSASASNNAAIVSSTGSVWTNSGNLYVGYFGQRNSLTITNGGTVYHNVGYLGYSNLGWGYNSAVVTGTGSTWNALSDLYIGRQTSGNVLTISDGGGVFDASGYVGGPFLSGTGNSALVSGAGSVWNSSANTYVGSSGSGNSLTISNGGKVLDAIGYVGYNSTSGQNNVLVADNGSTWSNNTALAVGLLGSGNSLTISNGGGVFSLNGLLAGDHNSSNNSVLVTGSGSTWNSPYGLYIGDGGGWGNTLRIVDGGTVINGFDAYVGWPVASSSNNSALVTGSGSVWSNSLLFIGSSGRGNSLTISNGGAVVSSSGSLSVSSASRDNRVLVTGTGSVWGISGTLYVGLNGAGSALTIANGGAVRGLLGYVGYNSSSSNNSVLVTGSGSVWTNDNAVWVGNTGAGNSLVISNGGLVVSNPLTQPQCGLGNNSGSSNNVVLVTGTGSVWKADSDFSSGGYGHSNALVISDGGQVLDGNGKVGGHSDNNSVLVTGSGSVWSNGNALYVGDQGSGNRLVISNGGLVISGGAATSGLGSFAISSNNSALVTGAGSVWSNRSALNVGSSGWGNRLVISNGGQVVSEQDAYVGYSPSSSDNSVRVVDGGLWRNHVLYVGYLGSGNSLFVAGGSVFATSLTVGFASRTCDNLVQSDSGSVIVTNATADAVLEVRNGKFILNGGMLQVDKLVITNACARFIRNGGTLIVGTLVLDPNMSAVGDGISNGWKQQYGLDPFDPNLANEDADGDGMSNLQEFQAGTDPTNSASAFRITDIAQEGDDMRVTWTMGTAKTNALQAAAGDDGSYTNSYADIFTVTNTVGAVTNYLDTGAATNSPAKYYRVRLVP